MSKSRIYCAYCDLRHLSRAQERDVRVFLHWRVDLAAGRSIFTWRSPIR